MDGFEINLSDYLPLRDVVYKSIRDAILSGVLKPGERLMEKDLALKLGVSRTPIRESMRKLEIEGYVEIVPRKGAVVRGITGKEVEDVLEIRSALEALAAKRACQNISDEQKAALAMAKEEFEQAAQDGDTEKMARKDVEFHDIIFMAAENEKLMLILNNLREQIYRFRITYLYDKQYINNIISEHGKIMEAIANNDSLLAYELSAEHVNNQLKAIARL